MPEIGPDFFTVLSPPQKRLLQEARVSIDWARMRRIANIKSTKWETTAQSPYRKLALELWEWPAGNILELSTKVGRHEVQSKPAALQRLVDRRRLSLTARQG